MAERIKSMRTQLHKALKDAGAPGNWDHVINQRGMFSFTGLNKVGSLALHLPASQGVIYGR